MKREFYVYYHINKKTQEVFYVGKGKHERAYMVRYRNVDWDNYTKNNDYEVKILKRDLTEKEAFDLESEEIDRIGIDNLVNRQRGRFRGTIDIWKVYNDFVENHEGLKQDYANGLRINQYYEDFIKKNFQ